MKYLSDYTEQRQTDLFNKTGAFFAFSNAQFTEKQVKDIQYVKREDGLMCPKNQVKTLTNGLQNIKIEGIASDLQENGKDAIIKRELYNHEAFHTMKLEQTFDALNGYNITQKEITKVFDSELMLIDWNKY